MKKLESVTIIDVLEVGDKVYKRLSFTHNKWSGVIGTLVSINPCIVIYDDNIYQTWDINELEYKEE